MAGRLDFGFRTGMTGEEFAMVLLEKKQVALVLGSAYGEASYRNFVRIASPVKCEELKKAFAAIREFIAENQK